MNDLDETERAILAGARRALSPTAVDGARVRVAALTALSSGAVVNGMDGAAHNVRHGSERLLDWVDRARDGLSASKVVAAALALAESRATSPAAPPPSADEIRATLSKLDTDIARVDARVHERLRWKFAATSDQFKHDTTAKLVAELTSLMDPDPKKGLLADVRLAVRLPRIIGERAKRGGSGPAALTVSRSGRTLFLFCFIRSG